MYLKIHVVTDGKKETIKKVSIDRYDISVREPAEGNHANERILEIINQLYPTMRVRIVNGHHTPAKIISLEEKS